MRPAKRTLLWLILLAALGGISYGLGWSNLFQVRSSKVYSIETRNLL